ncbi:MAG: radical SAM protein [Ruminococcus sp.]|nr:radical SAM protein [Ruminococcus sp.]
MKRSNISIFVPFAGCPNRCSFCDQHRITGVVRPTTEQDVRIAVETALSSGGIDSVNSEIAFFGGSFTAIDKDYMISLLSTANEYIDYFKGIRISTRPDCIDEETLTLLKSFSVTSIELGAQSMSDEVLRVNTRGHNSDCVRTASQLIKQYGFSLGLQMMTGLYGSNDDTDLYTAQEFIRLSPDTVRIYPTVVLEGTKLAEHFVSGEYNPQTVDSAVNLCAQLIPMFEDAGINVIRVGLHSSDTMESSIIAGAYHPAFRELCENRIFLTNILKKLAEDNIPKGKLTIKVASGAVSKATGQKKSNLTVLMNMGYIPQITEDVSLTGRQIKIEEG